MTGKKPLFYYEKDGLLIEGSKELFYSLTNAHFLSEMRITSPLQKAPQNQNDKQIMPYVIPLYKEYCKSPPLLCIKEKSLKHFAIHAHEDLQKGQVIVEYLGELSEKPKKLSSYRFGPIDAEHHRNLASLIEDGFPNAAAFYLYDVENVPLRVVFIALENIKAGEMILINYGIYHSVKTEYHEEYRYKEMKEFFTKSSLSDLVQKIKRESFAKRSHLNLELESLIAKVQYLFQSPTALIHLILDKVLKVEEVFSIFDTLDSRVHYLGYSFTPNLKEEELYEEMLILKRYFLKKEEDPRILDLLQKVRVRIVIKYFLRHLSEGKEAFVEEAILWEKALTALVEKDADTLQESFFQSKEKDLLLEELFTYSLQKGKEFHDFLKSFSSEECEV